MIRMWHVAWREFTSVVLTKGFVLGILLTPVIMAVAGLGIALMSRLGAPKIEGRLAVIDASNAAAPFVVSRFSAEALQKSQDDSAAKLDEEVNKQLGGKVPKQTLEAAKAHMPIQARTASALPQIDVEVIPPGADIEVLKTEVRNAEFKAERRPDEKKPLMGLVVIPQDAVTSTGEGVYGKFEIFLPPKLDFEVQQRMERQVGQAIVDARLVTDQRVTASRLTPAALRGMLEPPSAKAVTLTSGGERESVGGLQVIIPIAFMVLLMISVMSAGQYLMTALIEEKSSRVMEVLLSAVSPMQLMVGKILGQMAVALLILLVYGGLGVGGLVFFAMMDLVEPIKLVWFVCYFFIAFFTVASLMAAIGSAVNEMREAQTLLTPVMMTIVLPWVIWPVIQRAPNSTLATVLSFVPFVNPYVMVLRLGGSEPIPFWEIPASLAIGVATMVFVAWAAAKIFRIGVLMYGKPPNLATLIKWVRMA